MNLELVPGRLAVILSAGLVGYSLIMRFDETGTLAQLHTLRSSVRRASRGLP